MKKSSFVDYQKALIDTVLPKRQYKLSEVEDKIIKVAFDVVRFKDGDPEKLWQIENSTDGDYIVAMYEENLDELTKEASSKNTSNWQVVKQADYVQVFYKNKPITRLSAQDLNVPADELDFVASYLPEKIETNSVLRQSLINDLSQTAQANLLTTFPELK